MPLHGIGHDGEDFTAGAGHIQHQASPGRQHAVHLPQGGVFVFHKLQAHLAQHHIIRLVGEGQVLRARLMPVEGAVRRKGAGYRQHARVDVDPGDGAVSGLLAGQAGHDAGSAGNVQHLFALAQLGQADMVFGHGFAYDGHEVPFVVLGRLGSEGIAVLQCGFSFHNGHRMFV